MDDLQNRPMKAWIVRDIYYDRDYCAVVFARSRNEARSLAMHTDACEDLGYMEIHATRRKELDVCYRGHFEMDWYDPQDRIDLVRLGGFSCTEEIDDGDLECNECPAAEWCDRFIERSMQS